MTERIKLVQGDTRPRLVVTLRDEIDGEVVNITGCTPRLKFRAQGASALTATLVGTVVDGANGVCFFDWDAPALSGAAGPYEGEIEVTFPDGRVQTVYDILKFNLRREF